MFNPHLTTREAAKVLGMHPRTLTRRVHAGEIPAAQKLPGVRGAYLFDRDEIAALAPEAAQ